MCATRSPGSAAIFPTASSSRRSAASTSPTSRSAISRPKAPSMTVEQLSWFIDDTLNRRLMGIEGVSIVSRTGGVSREIRVELDPVADAGAGRHRLPDQPAAPRDEHQRRRRPCRDRRLRAIGPRRRQRAHCPRAGRDPDFAGRRPDDPAELRRHRPRPMGRADLLRHSERPPGGQLHDPEGEGLFGRHRLSTRFRKR